MFTILSFILILTLFLAWWTLDTSKIRRGLTIILAAILFTYMGLNYIGFCWDQFRFFSDDKKIKIILLDKAKTNLHFGKDLRATHYSTREEFILEPMLFTDINDFLRKNPNCCSIINFQQASALDFITPTLMERCGGWSTIVLVKYTNPITGKNEITGGRISNCGKVWKD